MKQLKRIIDTTSWISTYTLEKLERPSPVLRVTHYWSSLASSLLKGQTHLRLDWKWRTSVEEDKNQESNQPSDRLRRVHGVGLCRFPRGKTSLHDVGWALLYYPILGSDWTQAGSGNTWPHGIMIWRSHPHFFYLYLIWRVTQRNRFWDFAELPQLPPQWLRDSSLDPSLGSFQQWWCSWGWPCYWVSWRTENYMLLFVTGPPRYSCICLESAKDHGEPMVPRPGLLASRACRFMSRFRSS